MAAVEESCRIRERVVEGAVVDACVLIAVVNVGEKVVRRSVNYEPTDHRLDSVSQCALPWFNQMTVSPV